MKPMHDVFELIDGRRTELLIQVSTDAISAALVYFSSQNSPQILAFSRKKISLNHENLDFFDNAVSHLSEIVDEMVIRSARLYEIDELLQDHQAIHGVSFFLSSPLINKRVFQMSFLQDQIDQLNKNETHINDYLDFDIPQGNSRLDTIITSVHANGYETNINTALSQKLISLDLSCMDIYMRFDYMETLFQVIQTKLNISEKQTKFFSLESAYLLDLKLQYLPQDNYLVAHIHKQYTDISIFSHGKLTYSEHIDFGFENIEKQMISSGLVANLNQFESMMAMYEKNHTESNIANMIEENFEKSAKEFNLRVDEISDPNTARPRVWYVLHERKEGAKLNSLLSTSGSQKIINCTLHADINTREVKADYKEELTHVLDSAISFLERKKRETVVR